MASKKNFGQPEPGYIPGLYRGAVGFFTRSDIGPARNLGNDYMNPQTANLTKPNQRDDNTDNDLGDYSETRYDKWNGYEGSLFANTEYNDEDREADKLYSEVDRYMDGRRKNRREAKLKERIEKFRNERPTISQQFSDLRKDLGNLSRVDWENIPEVNDYTIKKKKQERYTAVPDRIIDQARNDGEVEKSIDPKMGTETIFGTTSNLNELGKAKNSVLSLVFDKMLDSVSGQKTVNPLGYLTDLNSIKINSATDISDFKKARLLLKSVINTNPKEVAGWIAAARLEELDGKIQQARNIIAQATENILDNESIWLEAARLYPPDESKVILAKAISHITNSEKLWIAAANKETEKSKKAKILRKALEQVPFSFELWKQAIDIEVEDEAKILLYRAVECVPHVVELWLALAKLETYDKAKEILNRARKEIPTSHIIWINAAKLEETQNSENNVDENIENLINRCIKSLTKNGVNLTREQWLNEAEICERSGALKTLSAIVKASINIDVDPLDRKKKWLESADVCLFRGCIETARRLYEHGLDILPNKKALWIKAIELEKQYGTSSSLEKLLSKACNNCPQKEIFWLIYAKHKWNNEGIEAAKKIILEAKKYHPKSEEVILALVKLERESNQYENAKKILSEAREQCNSARISMQAIQLEREQNNISEANKLCDESLILYPNFPKLWIIAAQIKEKLFPNYEEAAEIYSKGIEKNPNYLILYTCLSKLYLLNSNDTKARSILEKARLIFQSDPLIWIESIRLEIICDNVKGAGLMVSKALQECPLSGQLWVLAIELEPKHQKKAKALDALNKCDHDAHVMIAIAKIFIEEKMIEKARKWFEKATKINPDLGDAWAYYYKMEIKYGNDDKSLEIIKKCVDQNPRHGELWCSQSKQVECWKLKTDQILIRVAHLINL